MNRRTLLGALTGAIALAGRRGPSAAETSLLSKFDVSICFDSGDLRWIAAEGLSGPS